MKIINTEMIIEALLGIGFDKVDNILLTLVTGIIVLEREKNGFVLKNEKSSDFFYSSIKYDGTCFKIKDKFFYSSLYINELENLYYKLRNQNNELSIYLENLDYNEIILKKMKMLNIKNYNDLVDSFSNKEIEIIKNIFNYNTENVEENENIIKIYKKMISRVN